MEAWTDCPICGQGHPMVTANSRRVGSYIRRWRRCNECGHRDKVLVEPERIIAAPQLVRYRTTDRPEPPPDALC